MRPGHCHSPGAGGGRGAGGIKRLASEAFGEPGVAVCLITGITPGFSAKSLPEGVGGGGRGSKG